MRIFKYEINLLFGVRVIQIPKNAQILDIQIQSIVGNSMAVLWAAVDEQEAKVNLEVVVVPTGSSAPPKEKYKYFRTAQDRALVYHFYLPY
jgi:hypothetical protein